MKKLITLLASLALTTTLVAGCNKKKAEESKDQPAAKATDDKAATPPTTPPAPEAKTAPAAAGDLPAECTEYKSMIDKVATCDKLPQASRDAFKQSYDAMSSAWANIAPEAKAQLGVSCKQAADTLKQSAATLCGW